MDSVSPSTPVDFSDGPGTDLRDGLQEFRVRYPNRKRMVSGLPWNYRVCGEGPRALLMLPGGLGNDLAFGLVAGLVSRFRVVYPAYPVVQSLADVLYGIAAILTAENIASVSICGVSTGGMVAQCFMRRYPERVERLVLSNTGVPIAHWKHGRRAANAILSMAPWPLLRVPLAMSITKLLDAPAADRPFWRAYAKELFAKYVTKAEVLSNLRLQLEYQEDWHFSPEDLAGWPGKVFIVESDNDIFNNPTRREAMLDTYPLAPVYTIRGGGHMPAFTRTGEYLEMLRQFL
jgi:pimeloyl-ACP methyl ester carboxylesterase